MSTYSDIAIIGAGPAGATAAWRLAKEGISCTIVDKSTFPRDKTCGDALSGKALTLLRRLDPQSLTRLCADGNTEPICGIRFVAPNGKSIELPFGEPQRETPELAAGMVSRRLHFDHFLIKELQRFDQIDLQLGVQVSDIQRKAEFWSLSSKDGKWQHECRLLLVADGAQSSFGRHVAGLDKRPQHHAGAVRAYMQGVKGFHPDGFIELHFLKEYLPGYFWAFPLPNGMSNIGLGMRTDKLSKRKLNLRQELESIMQSHRFLAERFEGATLEEKIIGYPLPLGSKLRRASGDAYMVLGDAGHMIDPLTGEGIGNGMYAGIIAAEHALEALRQNRLDADFMTGYDVRIKRVLGKEMEISYNIQLSLRFPWLINGLANFVAARPDLIHTLSRMYTDLELRSQLSKPGFWLDMAFRKNPAVSRSS